MPFETRRTQPVSPSRGVNRSVGPGPRRWGYGSVKRCSLLWIGPAAGRAEEDQRYAAVGNPSLGFA
eukprot:8196169-Pyramimonas_sp.AAC.1